MIRVLRDEGTFQRHRDHLARSNVAKKGVSPRAVRDRKPAAGLLAGRLPEGFLQPGCIRRDGARSVDQERTQPVPQARGGIAGPTHRSRTVQQQLLEHRKRQTHTGTAVGRRRKRETRQSPQVFDGGVEPEGLKHEQLYCHHRPEFTVPPTMFCLLARGQDQFLRQMFRNCLP